MDNKMMQRRQHLRVNNIPSTLTLIILLVVTASTLVLQESAAFITPSPTTTTIPSVGLRKKTSSVGSNYRVDPSISNYKNLLRSTGTTPSVLLTTQKDNTIHLKEGDEGVSSIK